MGLQQRKMAECVDVDVNERVASMISVAASISSRMEEFHHITPITYPRDLAHSQKAWESEVVSI